ncbi:DNA/RNA non-specific endonuclease [Rippkaea orientalis PCC 8801]|uniref:DNA/RNA non-specific endonuclease n=1 Tax=Rippkaea orientalis (strain PCC 8801 / RF-1) TaxID=41431 RepID=B7JZ64_RIPO1|nr:DNA/RNA non-specific endonuclease [Rippkaea orientalis]ACK67275.1 DNA/RNA non-specific endonuclease [Rippkaea orientalis PCC 8801]
MVGYQPDFLGADQIVDLPRVSPEQTGNIVRSEQLREGFILDYPNYSVVMNGETRQAFFSAANADFRNNNGEGRSFRIDSRIDVDFQLDDIYYRNLDGIENPYDRGHLTRRAAVAWGETQKQANDASRDSCYFPNVSLQHRNFNQDEWNALERAVETNETDLNDKFNIFVGPIFTPMDRFLQPTPRLEPARIPSAFWKIIAYIGRESQQLETKAFIVFQDDMAIQGMNQVLNNPQLDPFSIYQSSTTLIEQLTGLEFPEVLFERNPLFFFANSRTTERNIVTPQLNRVTPLASNNSQIIFQQ